MPRKPAKPAPGTRGTAKGLVSIRCDVTPEAREKLRVIAAGTPHHTMSEMMRSVAMRIAETGKVPS
jgi:hypothetical protein